MLYQDLKWILCKRTSFRFPIVFMLSQANPFCGLDSYGSNLRELLYQMQNKLRKIIAK